MRKRTIGFGFFIFLSVGCLGAQATTFYSITPVGLIDTEHVDSNGQSYSSAEAWNNSAQVVGSSERYRSGLSTGVSAWFFNNDSKHTQEIGLTGSGYENTNTGYRYSTVFSLNNTGQAFGRSYRYNGATAAGVSAWFFNSGSNQTQEIGLTGSGYENTSTGYRYSLGNSLNDAGQVIGYSNRYNATTAAGQSTWFFNSDSNQTQEIGLTGSGYMNTSTGERFSSASFLNAAGQAIGYSNRYNATTAAGQSAWFFNSDSNQTQEIGLTGSGFVNTSTGYQFSSASFLNAAGQALGYSNRYNAATAAGQSAWIFSSDSNQTQEIGLTGSGFINTSTSVRFSYASALNDAGQAIGSSNRYNGATNAGRAAWFFNSDSNQTQEIGLTGSGFVNTSTGYQYSSATFLNDAGQVIGYSNRYNGATNAGRSAWFFDSDSNQTQEIGLTGSGFVNTSTGYQYSSATFLNDAGQAIGYSTRYNGATTAGQSAWFFNSDSNQTQEIGLTGSGFINTSTGERFSSVSAINDAGQAIGSSGRYNGATSAGESAWFFDFNSNVLFDLTFSVLAGTNKAFSIASFLAENGTVLGEYDWYNGGGNATRKVFSWSMEDGFTDLGLMVEGGLDANGWRSLYKTLTINAAGQILGRGQLTNSSQMPYLLTPLDDSQPVPEPATMFLLGTGLAGMLAVRRRRV